MVVVLKMKGIMNGEADSTIILSSIYNQVLILLAKVDSLPFCISEANEIEEDCRESEGSFPPKSFFIL